MLELDRLGRKSGSEDEPQEHGGRERVAEGVVRVELDVVSDTERLEVVRRRKRFEQPERFEGAGDGRRPVLDAYHGEIVFQHREVEARVVGDEDRAFEEHEKLEGKLGERRRARDVGVGNAVHSGGLWRDRLRRSDESHQARNFVPSGVEPDDGKRHDLVALWVDPGRFAVEDGVAGRRRHVAPPTYASGNRVHG